jgi:hypothetical protein
LHTYCMHFNAWLLQRLPDSDRLTLLIQAAGTNGIPEGELRSRVELPKKLVDELLQALLQSGMVGVCEKGGKRVIFSR